MAPLASRFTSSITGKAPAPVPTTSLLQFQGMSSWIDSGVWPNASRNGLEALPAFADLAVVDDDVVVVCDAVDTDGAEGEGFQPHGGSAARCAAPDATRYAARFPARSAACCRRAFSSGVR